LPADTGELQTGHGYPHGIRSNVHAVVCLEEIGYVHLGEQGQDPIPEAEGAGRSFFVEKVIVLGF
jgi:hypothetical protein